MSEALYGFGGLRFWDEDQIAWREVATEKLFGAVSGALRSLNSAWQFHRCEGPILTPRPQISDAYAGDDVWLLNARLGGDEMVLRPETTPSSYTVARHLLKTIKGIRLPLCVWQSGKSFRRETNDGARVSKLRFNEFYQVEFQCIYAMATKADYRAAVTPAVQSAIGLLTGARTQIVLSDRLPSYSTKTVDVEAEYRGIMLEMCSISTRTDFSEVHCVLEVAAGLDRIVSLASETWNREHV